MLRRIISEQDNGHRLFWLHYPGIAFRPRLMKNITIPLFEHWHCKMKQLIVNADDLGLSPAVNDAIMQGAEMGVITAASLMVNMPFTEEAAEQVKATCPHLSLALHFCLTSGHAVLPPHKIPALVDAQGRFKRGFMWLWRGLNPKTAKKDVLAQVMAEFHAQLERMEHLAARYSLCFDHLDSHQHIHVLPWLLLLFRQVADERHLVLRIPRETFGGCRRVLRRFASWCPGGLARKAILDHHLRRAEHRFGDLGERQIGYFGILDTGQVGLAAFREIVRVIRNDLPGPDIFELNIHPALCEDIPLSHLSPTDRSFQRSPWRQREFELVNSPVFSTFLVENGIELTSFAAVTA